MRRLNKSFSFNKVAPSEYADKIGKIPQPLYLHRRNKENRCSACYSTTMQSFVINDDCVHCIAGYLRGDDDLFIIMGYAQIQEFPANDGAGQLLYKTGGEQAKIATYIYVTFQNARMVTVNDHFLFRNHGIIDELVVFNIRPQSPGSNSPIGSLLECTSSSDKRMADKVEDYESYL